MQDVGRWYLRIHQTRDRMQGTARAFLRGRMYAHVCAVRICVGPSRIVFQAHAARCILISTVPASCIRVPLAPSRVP